MEKINFQTELDNLIERIGEEGKRPGLLLHSCCGPCSSYCLEYLKDYFDITVLYYNPNIYPEEEYRLRLSEQSRLIDELNRNEEHKIKLISVPYEHKEFTDYVVGLEKEKEGGARCEKCFELRLKTAADTAEKMNLDYVGTTLTVSPHKNALLLNQIGQELCRRDGCSVCWLPSDFKKKDGYKRSIELSKIHNLYRQNYCGCEFSIWF